MYRVLLIDADHTLIDYKKDELAAFSRMLPDFRLPADEESVEYASSVSEETWTEVGLYDVQSERIQREYHALYRSHVEILFERLFSHFGVTGDSRLAGARFLKELEAPAHLIEGSKETLERLKGRYQIAVATNGVCSIQEGRLLSLAGHFSHLFVSERLGAIKPTAAFFERALQELGAKKEECLMIGDSVTSDVDGAASFGLDACWFNPMGKKMRTAAKYEIRNLSELLEIL